MGMIQWLRKISPSKLGGTALLRLDFNTEDEWRMEAAIPTLEFLLKHAAHVVVVSHRGRPDGVNPTFSLKKDAVQLRKLLHRPVTFVPHLDFMALRTEIAASPRGSVFLLENLRFVAGEEKNDASFAKQLASFADYYVNDAFAVSHRNAASVSAITKVLPSYGGLELEKEIVTLSRLMLKPKKPLVVILGGGKAHDKLGVIKFLKSKTQAFILGGAAANTFLKIKGVNVRASLVDEVAKDYKSLREVADYPNIALPIDWEEEGERILDIGPKSEELFSNVIATAGTIIWSGPLGFIEKKKFAAGTTAIAKAVVKNTKAFKVAGGGETVMFLKKLGLDSKMDFISTGGGALLDYLAGEKLPGIVALQ
jgi:phosphoglycerate kinase